MPGALAGVDILWMSTVLNFTSSSLDRSRGITGVHGNGLSIDEALLAGRFGGDYGRDPAQLAGARSQLARAPRNRDRCGQQRGDPRGASSMIQARRDRFGGLDAPREHAGVGISTPSPPCTKEGIRESAEPPGVPLLSRRRPTFVRRR